MPKLLNLYSGTSGLSTQNDPVREVFDSKTGLRSLSSAVNVTIDNTGRISRRQGYVQIVSGEFHSLWSDSGECFAIKETSTYGSLMQVGTDLQATGLRASLTKDKRMAFLNWNNDTLYSNGFENGIVINGVSFDWPSGEYEGPETSRQFSEAPKGTHLAKFKGRVIIAEDNALWFSEPYAPGMYDKSRMFWQFADRVRMVAPVESGVFVSDEKYIYFLQGSSPLDFIQKKVADYPAHEWSLAHDKLELEDFGYDEVGLGSLWSSQEGICVGLPSGKLQNVTKDKLEYPLRYNKGASLTCGYHVINTMY